MNDQRQLVSQHWGDHDFTDRLHRIHWMASPVVRAYLNQLASGHPATDWLTWAWRQRVLKQLPGRAPLAVLVLGCGTGWLERSLVSQDRVGTIDACDVSEGAVAEAAELARAAGLGDRLRYHVVDLNEEAPPAAEGDGYDVVVAHSVLHHVENLEAAYPRIAAALVPGGLLVMNEYLGPTRFQFTDAQMAAINAVLARLPERLRWSLIQDVPFPHKVVPTVEEMIAVDPSESVRSAELLAFTRRHFEILDEVPYGGTVLQHLLYDVVQNFDPASLREARLLALLCLLEEALIREGELPSDYGVVVARRPASERGRPRRADLDAPLPATSPGPVPGAVPVGRVVAEAGGEAVGGPRPGIHSRPWRRLRHGLDLPPLSRHLHRLATGDPDCDWTTWVLGQVVAGRERGRALVIEEPPSWLGSKVRRAPEVEALDLLLPVWDRGRLRFAFQPAGESAPGPALALADLRLPAAA
ncbi:MAG TPA: class I SAM-dependent methyltransferase, partial [Thermoanaerobaculia bacterium]|nr:class I SAM-dependent methyltransferase [Thermoanaerobaculia bacterium]